MTNVQDVAAALIERRRPMDTWKLQKLAYYCQAWHLVWEDHPLFPERIEAWAAGPVVRDLYEHHRGLFSVSSWEWGNAAALDKAEESTVDNVFGAYGHLTGSQLRLLTHKEAPWRRAREGLAPGDRSSKEIPVDDMLDYYSGLADDDAAVPIDELLTDSPAE